MGMLKDFKDFALKGNVVDLAVAVIIGGAFGTIVSSLVDDVITPLLLTPALKLANAENIDKLTWGAVKYGKFLAAIIKFIIIAWILFLLVRGMKKMAAKKEAAAAPPPGPTPTEQLLMEIRDELKKK
ncbi:large conductance mechanosensitive channel protein MscL [Pseudoflavitalea rhizosphaerae]|uniref:large conductance mechanosensitive channel protein MscL n=1 Tax=Pseudoflavitalea rhizosphaerae TaxID=1884793 RepID=UPI000F8F6D91|nr:large conductance mechanosensitive channel protein MscL [Pseudoflavitalea rhizosphaerae]